MVLFFFPKAFTRTCERQVVEHAQRIDDFKAMNARVLGVSTDEVPALLEFAQHCEAAGKITLLSDSRRQAIKEYGVTLEGAPVPNGRATFIIDREGVLRYGYIEPDPRHFQGVAPELEALQQIEAGGTL